MSLKSWILLISILLLFIAANTYYFWGSNAGPAAFLATIFGLIIWFILLLGTCGQIGYFSAKPRSWKYKMAIALNLLLLLLICFYPFGIIDFEKLKSEVLFTATRESSASCSITLKLRADKEFTCREICFGSKQNTGTYILKNDTVFFNLANRDATQIFYKFGVIIDITDALNIHRSYIDLYDSVGQTLRLPIVKNELSLVDPSK